MLHFRWALASGFGAGEVAVFLGNLASVVVRSALILGAATVLLWTITAAGMRVSRFVAEPDLNGDGQFTIIDVPLAFVAAFVAIGNQVQTALAETPLGQFAEMHSDPPNWIWTLIISLAAWFGPVGVLQAAWDYRDE